MRHATVFQIVWTTVSSASFQTEKLLIHLQNVIYLLCILERRMIAFTAWKLVAAGCLLNSAHIFLDVNALPSNGEGSRITMGAMVGSCVVSFLIGLTITVAFYFCYIKRRKPRIPGNPHYISKQNPYVTVPLKEVSHSARRSLDALTHVLDLNISKKPAIRQVNAKRQASFSGSTNGNGTLRSKTNPNVNGLGSPKLYPKSLDYESATLKRNSHGQQHIRADLDQDKYY